MKINLNVSTYFKEKVAPLFLRKDGEKTALNIRNSAIALGILTVAIGFPMYLFSEEEDTSYVGQSEKSFNQTDSSELSQIVVSKKVAQVLGPESKSASRPRSNAYQVDRNVNYKAVQVIVRDNTGDPEKTVPIGTNFIGKTLTAIDTREPNQTIKVLLPYGGKAKVGAEIEKNTILFGHVTYSGKGGKLYLALSSGLSPGGKEFSIQAQALNPKDYSPGIAGRSHSNSDLRMLSALGMTVVAGAASIYTEREVMGGSGATVPRQTLQNALYQGVSQQAQAEASKKAENADVDDYLTVPAGTDVIVSLTKSFTVQESGDSNK